MKNRFGIADIALIVTTFLWGLNAVITKNAIGDTPETFRIFVYNGLRIPLGAIVLLLTVKLSGRPIEIRWKHVPLIMSVSFFGMFFFMTGFVLGIHLTSASNMGVFNATIPLLILLISMIAKIERPTLRIVTGILIGFIGLLALVLRGGGFRFNPGDAVIFMACTSWAYYTVFAKKIVAYYEPMLAMAWVYVFTALYQLPLFLWQLPEQDWASVSIANWINIAISVGFSLFIANSLYYFAIKKTQPSRVAIYTNLTPVFTVLLAVIIRGEQITALQIAGLVVIIIGIIVSRSGGKTSPPQASVSGRAT